MIENYIQKIYFLIGGYNFGEQHPWIADGEYAIQGEMSGKATM